MTTQTTTTTPLWKSLIEIPEHRSTFVLKLTEGLDQAHQTVDQYVVTPSLAGHFDQALSVIKRAMNTQSSQAAFLHGSFGSGKSHFMAVLNLLLQKFQPARAIDALTDVVVKHQWMDQKKFLMVPYHMLGSKSMEAAILGGYVDYVAEHHPDQPLPGVYLADSILDNADKLRAKMGDAVFFASLNGESTDAQKSDGHPASGLSGESSVSKWGSFATRWSAESYEQARVATAHNKAERDRLVGAVVAHLMPSVRDTARVANEQKFVSLDEGLATISRHAKSMGYDGLILFLDELILWLSSRSSNVEFMRSEIDKISKLVEAQHADRPIPIISFVARQRDLKEMLGDELIGDERARMGLSLESLQGRFHTIELEDRNLPVIASERLLRPQSAEARELIRQSFESFDRSLNSGSRDTMLTSRHDDADFKLVYPFSPALVQALIALSTTLQRDRTALKLMQTLLIERRDDLKLGEIIPVGDLWDVISEGDEPMNNLMRDLMRIARRLWDQKLLPALRHIHGIDPNQPDLNPNAARQFQTDARLLKTLLVAALVPKLELFEELSIDRLIALNHGSIRAPIPGAERTEALRRLRNLASEITEISILDGPNPVVKLRLEDIDIEPILRAADNADNPGARLRKVKSILYHWLGVQENHALRAEYQLDWQGARRTVYIGFGNIREMPFDRLTAQDDHWLLVFDYPFDEGDHGPKDDTAALANYREERRNGSNTIAWIPTFLTKAGTDLLGRLVKIEDVLARFDDYTSSMRQEDRPIARGMLENGQKSVEKRLHDALLAAYGLAQSHRDLLDEGNTLDQHVYSLRHGFKPTLPFGRNLKDAFEELAIQALKAQYPAFYKIPNKALRSAEVQKIYEVIRGSIGSDERRFYVENRTLRTQMHNYAVPLNLGLQGDTNFVYKSDWADEIQRRLQPGDKPFAVGKIYELLDSADTPTGLPHLLKDLIVLAYVDMEDMLIRRDGRELDPSVGSLRADDKIERRRLPDETAWQRATRVATEIFGLRPPRIRNSRNVQHLARELTEAAQPTQEAGLQIAGRLAQVGAEYLGMTHDDIAGGKRHAVATQMRELLLATEATDPTALLEAIAAVHINENDASAIRTSLQRAASNLNVLNDNSLWAVIKALATKADPSTAEQGLTTQIRDLLLHAEHVTPLVELREFQPRILALITAETPATPPVVTPTPEPVQAVQPDEPDTKAAPTASLTATEPTQAITWLKSHFDAHPGKKLTISIHVENSDD